MWTRDHSVIVSGAVVERKKGEPVGQLMHTWRANRLQVPELYVNVEVFGQKEATMDQSICMLLSDQLRHEELPALGVKQCVYQTDCAGCVNILPEEELRLVTSDASPVYLDIRTDKS